LLLLTCFVGSGVPTFTQTQGIMIVLKATP
jgi:hypothetical protein